MTTKRSTISIILKAVVILSAAIGIPLSALADVTGFMAGKTVFMFFTVQSNILIAGICLAGAVFFINTIPKRVHAQTGKKKKVKRKRRKRNGL